VSRRSRLTKVLRYRDRTGASQAAHAAHWQGFTWSAGATIVAALGSWGTCQVWASSESEGKRVIRHAAAIGGFDPDGEEGAEWIVAQASGGRNGRSAQMVTMEGRQGLRVSKRAGPSGSPAMNI
jgi:hypothetical protein